MNIPASPAPRFAGVYEFKRYQFRASAIAVTPEEVIQGPNESYDSQYKKNSLQAVLESKIRQADAKASPQGDAYSRTPEFIEVDGRLVGVSGTDLQELAVSQDEALGKWLGLKKTDRGRKLLDSILLYIRKPWDVTQADTSEVLSAGWQRVNMQDLFGRLLGRKSKRNPGQKEQVLQQVYQAFLQAHQPKTLRIRKNAGSW